MLAALCRARLANGKNGQLYASLIVATRLQPEGSFEEIAAEWE
jgi:hypothetical protein